MVTHQPVIRGAATALAHTPSLVRYGFRPFREARTRAGFLAKMARGLRCYDDACRYLPNQVFVGTRSPVRLWEVEQPWFDKLADADNAEPPFGRILEERRFLALLACADPFRHVRLRERFWEETGPVLASEPLTAPLAARPPALLGDARMDAALEPPDSLPLFAGGESAPVGVVETGHSEDEALAASVLLENLCCKVSGALAVHALLHHAGGLGLGDVDLVLRCSEEAVGDRYQRGGNMAKAIAEFAGCARGTGIDIKDFCAAPLPALVIGASLVASGVFENVVVVGGGSLPKLGMKSLYHLEQGVPVLEDALAAVAVWTGRDDSLGAKLNLRAVGRHPVRAGAAIDKQFRELVPEPLRRRNGASTASTGSSPSSATETPNRTTSQKAGEITPKGQVHELTLANQERARDRTTHHPQLQETDHPWRAGRSPGPGHRAGRHGARGRGRVRRHPVLRLNSRWGHGP